MRRRKLLWVSAVTLAVVGVAGFAAWPNRVTKENLSRIKSGMNRAEVEYLLGPPGDYRTGPGESDLCASGTGVWDEWADPVADNGIEWRVEEKTVLAGWEYLFEGDHSRATWVSDAGLINVFYDASDRVAVRSFHCRRTVAMGPLEQFHWRFGRCWRKWFAR
jgi:hypothetical protein